MSNGGSRWNSVALHFKYVTASISGLISYMQEYYLYNVLNRKNDTLTLLKLKLFDCLAVDPPLLSSVLSLSYICANYS